MTPSERAETKGPPSGDYKAKDGGDQRQMTNFGGPVKKREVGGLAGKEEEVAQERND